MVYFFLFSIHPSHPFRHLFFFLPSFLSSFLTILLSFLPSPPSFHPSFFSYFVASLGPSFVPSSLLSSLFPFFLSFPNSLLLFVSHWFISSFICSLTVTRLPWVQFPWWTGGQHQRTLRLCWYPKTHGRAQLPPRRISIWQNDPRRTWLWENAPQRRRQESLSFPCFLVKCNERDWWMRLWTCYLLVLTFEFFSHLRGVVKWVFAIFFFKFAVIRLSW